MPDLTVSVATGNTIAVSVSGGGTTATVSSGGTATVTVAGTSSLVGAGKVIVSSGGLADLTSEQQTQITQGVVVVTTDGYRWVFSGVGSVTSQTNYVQLADITPEWGAISGKPSTFAPSAHKSSHATGGADAIAPSDIGAAAASHTHAIADTTGLQTALDAKAPIASPTFTGTVSGVTKSMVGLGNVDNTSDANKPISNATQTALDGKAEATHSHVIYGEIQAAITDDPGTALTDLGAAAADHVHGNITNDGKVGTASGQIVVTGSGGALTTASTIGASSVSGLATVATSGSYNDLSNKPAAYSLPTASATVLGGIKVGSGLSIDGSSVLSATYSYTLPAATGSTLGGIIVGTGLGVSSGTVSVSYGTTSGTACQGNDSRLSDARTPTDGSVTDAKITSGGLSTSSLNWAAIQPWAENTAYAKGDLVSFQGIAYRRSAAGTSGATFNTNNWQQITPSEFVASQITSGTLATARLGSGTASSTTFLRGDQSYAPTSEVFEFTRTTRPASASGSGGSYTWSIPSTAKVVEFFMIGGGGGGGSGRRGAAGTARFGGGGGASASVNIITRLASELVSRDLTITVGAGGAGGAAQTANDTNGNNAGPATASTVYFGSNTTSWLNASRGGGGSGGTATTGSGGGTDGAPGAYGGTPGGNSSATGVPVGSNSANSFVGSGGGGGGGISTGDVGFAGAIGRANGWLIAHGNGVSGLVNTLGGAVPGGAGQNAADVFTPSVGAAPGGAGAGGGAGDSTTAGGNGGSGANYGGGGGGGGASFNGYNSGAGGNGRDGYVRITVWY